MFGQYYPTLNLEIEAMVVIRMCFYLLHNKKIYHKLLGGIPETIESQGVDLVANLVICIEGYPTPVTNI